MAKRKETYASSSGYSYSKIAKIMTEQGDEMNTSTTREIFLKGLAKLYVVLNEHNGKIISLSDAKKMVAEPHIQQILEDLIKESIN